MGKWIRRVLMILFAGILAFSLWKILDIRRSYQTGENTYADLQQYVKLPETQPKEDHLPPGPLHSRPDIQFDDDTPWPTIDFDALQEICPDIVGWIYIEGTNINYPVAQGKDNKYYLNHLVDGTWNSSGSIFLDAECGDVFTDRHSIIYGHHMLNNSMFSALMDYKKQSFYDAHPVALYITPERRCKIVLFSAYVAEPTENAWQVDFAWGGFGKWLREVEDKSLFVPKYTPTEDDQIVTLSTCSYEFDDARFVVHGFLLDYTPVTQNP